MHSVQRHKEEEGDKQLTRMSEEAQRRQLGALHVHVP